MSDVAKINQELSSLSNKLATASNEYTEASLKAADARSDYDVARAKALLRSEHKSVAMREAEATQACETEMRESRIASAIRDALKERVRALQSVLNAAQTKAGFLRDEMRLAGRDY